MALTLLLDSRFLMASVITLLYPGKPSQLAAGKTPHLCISVFVPCQLAAFIVDFVNPESDWILLFACFDLLFKITIFFSQGL